MIKANSWKVIQGQVRIGPVDEFIITSSGGKASSARTTSWTDPIDHIFTVAFADVPAATTFFSTGGQIRLSGDRVGGSSNTQNTSMETLLSDLGTVVFGENDTTRTGIAGSDTAIGYTSLTGSYQTIFTANSTTAQYTADEYKVEVLISGAVLTFKITLTDDSDNVLDEAVDGTLTSYIDERRHISTTSPVYTNIDEFEGALDLQATILAASPEWYWKFDETTGLASVDSMGNQNLTLNRNLNLGEYAATGLTSSSAGALRFVNHTENFQTIEATATTNQVGNLRADFTIEFGVKFEFIGSPTEILVASQPDPNWAIIYLDDGDPLYDGLSIYIPASLEATVVAPIATFAAGYHYWVSIRCDFTGTQVMSIEVNGVEIDTHTFTTETADWSNAVTTPGFGLANDESGTTIDDFAIHHRAISNIERANHAALFAAANTNPAP